MFKKNVLLLSSEYKSEVMVHKKGDGTGSQWQAMTAVYS